MRVPSAGEDGSEQTSENFHARMNKGVQVADEDLRDGRGVLLYLLDAGFSVERVLKTVIVMPPTHAFEPEAFALFASAVAVAVWKFARRERDMTIDDATLAKATAFVVSEHAGHCCAPDPERAEFIAERTYAIVRAQVAWTRALN